MSQSDLNQFAFCGRLTKDAEAAGTNADIAKIRLAVSGWAKDGGEQPSYFFDVVKYKSANLIQHLTKGKQIIVSGRVEWREWEQQTDGQTVKRQAVSFIANDLQFVGSKADGEAAPAPAADPEPDWVNDGAPE